MASPPRRLGPFGQRAFLVYWTGGFVSEGGSWYQARAAWGHAPTAQDTADVNDAIATAGADPAVAYESTCMAVFTAAEFVYR